MRVVHANKVKEVTEKKAMTLLKKRVEKLEITVETLMKSIEELKTVNENKLIGDSTGERIRL